MTTVLLCCCLLVLPLSKSIEPFVELCGLVLKSDKPPCPILAHPGLCVSLFVRLDEQPHDGN